MPPPSQAEVLLLKLFQAAKQPPPTQANGGENDDEREFLVLAEIAALQDTGKVPLAVNLLHLGVLYVLNGADRDREPGQFEFHDLYDFVERCEAEERTASRGVHAPTFFQQTKEARCLLAVWEVATSDGVHVITTWLMHLLRENGKALGEYREDSDAVGGATLALLGRVLGLDDGWTAHLASVPKGHAHDPSMDKWRHISAVAEYVDAFLAGWIDQLDRVGVSAAEISSSQGRS